MIKKALCFSLIALCFFYFANAQVTYTTSNGSRTETRDDASLRGDAGAKSGFYETANPINYPTGASSWWHLLDIRHSNPGNNYAMQFAGSFFNQDLFFRKTHDNGAAPWRKVLTSGSGILGTTVGNTLDLLSLDANSNGNQSILKISLLRHSNGMTWENTATRIQAITDATSQGYIDFNPQGSKHGLALGINNTDFLRIHTNGNVGIGSVNVNDAGFRLFVESGIRTRKVKVDLQAWPDYVFAQSYQLPTLAEVEAYIQLHKHLPDVPSAKEVTEKGLDLGENQAILLKKIEELTLYVIDLRKEVDALKKER